MASARVIVAGETLIDLFPDSPGDLTDVDSFEHRAGGAPANVAVGLARVADPPAFWTRLGGDPFGAFLENALADYGLDGEFVRRADEKTALAVVSPTPEGDRSFAFYEADTATLDFETGAVPDRALTDREVVHFGGVPLVRESGRAAMLDLAERARDADCTVSFDPNTRLDLWPDPGEAGRVFRRALDHTDVLFCSPEDLVALDYDPETARRNPESVAVDLLATGPHTVFLTRGGDGVTVATDATADGTRTTASAPAFDVDVADTTGAGDAFTAGALARYEPGLPASDLHDVLRFANATAALTTTQTGGMTAIPSRSEVAALLADRDDA